MQRIKIVHVIQNLSIQGGMQRVVTNLCNLLADKYDIEIWVWTDDKEIFFDVNPQITIRSLGPNPDDYNGKGLKKGLYFFRMLFNGFFKYKKLIKEASPNLIFIHRGEIDDVFMGFQRLFYNTKEVLHTPYRLKRTTSLAIITRIQRALFYHLFQPKKNFITVTETIKQDMLEDGWQNISAIHNTFNMRIEPKSNRTSNLFLTVGRNGPEKGFPLLIEAFAKFNTHDKGWKLRIVGSDVDTADNDLNQLVQKFGLQNYVELLPATANIEKHYQEAAIYILPSYYEAMSLVVLEAMEAGLPVICSEIRGIKEITNPDVVQIFKNGDVNALTDKMIFLTSQPELRDSMAEKAIIHVRNFYPDKIILHWEKLIAEVLK